MCSLIKSLDGPVVYSLSPFRLTSYSDGWCRLKLGFTSHHFQLKVCFAVGAPWSLNFNTDDPSSPHLFHIRI